MPQIKEIWLKCPYCGTRTRSPIFFSTTEAFESSTVFGSMNQCPSSGCHKMYPCNKENVSYTLADDAGGFVGEDFGHT
jgi:hypothetical protein